jgi:hypothetical protein
MRGFDGKIADLRRAMEPLMPLAEKVTELQPAVFPLPSLARNIEAMKEGWHSASTSAATVK